MRENWGTGSSVNKARRSPMIKKEEKGGESRNVIPQSGGRELKI